ncbi:MAG: glutamate/cysteine ligase family protein [Frankiales bacterium]|nr:glutamate/cysteine ligase family protein [Frankiales bacterium]
MIIRTRDQVAGHIDAAVRLGPPCLVGAELEWLVVDPSAPSTRPALERVVATAAPSAEPPLLPGGSVLTYEPGGQLELSSTPRVGPCAAVEGLRGDVDTVRSRLAGAGLALTGLGADPLRPPTRLVRTPRYDVMEAHYRRLGGPAAAAGAVMMCSTAAAQVSLDAGTQGSGLQSTTDRWQRAHAVGPALVAAFACSPLLSGRATGWRSSRQRTWLELDPSRTRPPAPELGPVEAMAELALSAQVMTVRDATGRCCPAPAGVTFADWMAEGAPDDSDLAYHLTTLFPPVRLRGWLELRYLDMLPDPLWQVPVAVAAALLDDDLAADAARAACEPVEGRWHDAARTAMGDPALARAALQCLLAAAEALPRMGAAALAREVLAFAEHYTARSRCPADDLLEAHLSGIPVEQLLVRDCRIAA